MRQALHNTVSDKRVWGFLSFYLSVLTLAEVFILSNVFIPGLSLHALCLVALLLHGSLAEQDFSELLSAMSIVPLIRILSLSMPVLSFSNRLALINIPIIIACLVAAYFLSYRRHDLGLRLNRLWFQLIIASSGLIIGLIESQLIKASSISNGLEFTAIIWPVISLLLFTGFSEELLFRGILQTASIKVLGTWPGIIYISLIFGIMHIGWGSLLDVFFVMLVGVFFAWVVHYSKSIFGVVLAHGLANIIVFIILPNLNR